MPTVKLGDQFGLSVQVVPNPLSGLATYFRDAVDMVTNGFDLSRWSGLDLRNPAITSFQTGLVFNRPAAIGPGGAALEVEAGLSGSLGVFVPGAAGGVLFDPDDYGDNIPVAADARYVSFGITASAALGGTAQAGSLSFGFAPGASFQIVNYRRFPTQPSAPTLAAALTATIQSFTLPWAVDDLAALPEAGIVILEGQGTLGFTAGANLLAIANPLATVSLPGGAGALSLKAGGSIDVNASFQVSCGYQIRIEKRAAGRIRLGYYRKRQSEATVGATLSAGVTAGIGGFDLYSTVIGAISGNPDADRAALAAAGLRGEQIAAIEGAVKAGIQRKLELAVSAELGSLGADSAAFLYEVELDALDPRGREAVARALSGNLAGLVEAERVPAAGITPLRSITSTMRQRRHTFKIDLLGIYNFISVSNLTLNGTVTYEPVTGNLVIADTATAERIRAERFPLSADPQRLRSVLAESFLITAAYRGSKSVAAAPELTSAHTFFKLDSRTGREEMEQDLQVSIALGLLPEAQRDALLGTLDDFGSTAFSAETRYGDALATALFLDSGQPRRLEEYETAGREAIQLLVRQGDPDDYRRRPAINDALWARMKSAGQPGFGALFPGLTDVQVAVVAADYSVIVWWARTMRETAEKLAALRSLVDSQPALGWDDQRFRSLRDDLKNHLLAVARDTREEFGLPWGLIAMDRVSGRGAEASVHLAGSRIALVEERGTIAGTASGVAR